MASYRRKHNPARIRERHCYTIEETASLLGVHKNTIRQWIKNGLACIDDVRPLLIHGSDLKSYISEKQRSAKQPCNPDEMYCLKCRAPRVPWEGIVDVVFISPKAAQLKGICNVCSTKVHRRTSVQKLPENAKTFTIQKIVNSSIVESLNGGTNRNQTTASYILTTTYNIRVAPATPIFFTTQATLLLLRYEKLNAMMV